MAIRNNLLTYGEVGSPWFEREIEAAVINTFAIAIVTTIVSYQATAIVTDLFLGFKKKGVSRSSHLHIGLLIRRSTPLAILNNVFRRDWLTRKYYHHYIPPSTKIAREEEGIKPGVLLKLGVLLLVAPFVNTVAVFFTGESERVLSFKEAEFGGVGLGVNEDLSVVNGSRISELCFRNEIDFKPLDTGLAQFTICRNPPVAVLHRESTGLVSVSIFGNGSIDIKVQIGVIEVWSGTVGTLFANDTVFVVKPSLAPENLSALVERGINRVSEFCGSDLVGQTSRNTSSRNASSSATMNRSGVRQGVLDGFRNVILEKSIECQATGNAGDAAFQILGELERFITFVNSDSLQLSPADNGPVIQEYKERDSLRFISRRKRRVGLSVLGILAGILLVLRVVSVSLLNNDVGVGIEAMVRGYVGFNERESILTGGDKKVWYNMKYQTGLFAQYGLTRDGWYQVEGFDGGVVGDIGVEGELTSGKRSVCVTSDSSRTSINSSRSSISR